LLFEKAGRARSESGSRCELYSLQLLLLIEVDNLAGLRSGNHIGEVGVLILGHSGRSLPFGHAFDAALFLVLLLLPTKLFSAAFFQLVASAKPPPSSARSSGRYRRARICVR
jgi:hypothetical protein